MTRALRLATGDHGDRMDLLGTAGDRPLREVLASCEMWLLDPLDEELLDRPWSDFAPDIWLRSELAPGTPLFATPGITAAPSPTSLSKPPAAHATGVEAAAEPERSDHPDRISDAQAVRLAYYPHIERVASLLRSRLPVLVISEKLIVTHLWEEMVTLAECRGIRLDDDSPEDESGRGDPVGDMNGASMSTRQRRLARLRAQLEELKEGDVIVLTHLDLLAGSADIGRHAEARELVELLYAFPDQLVLAFADPTLPLPDVLAERFSARVTLSGLPPKVKTPETEETLLGAALVTREEAETFEGFQPREFYKHVAGMNPVRLRQAMRYAHEKHRTQPKRATQQDLRETLLTFKAQQSSHFEVPNVTLDDIGGYDEVKDEIRQTLAIISGAQSLPDDMEEVRSELVPRGIIFYGPPGTGKTLFAKAIANGMNATIQVVSGPEVTDMYVGESERKVREIFASARRSAPSVIVFDEIDAITMERSNRPDGGSRAGNSVVAQILTEMDGFRPEVPMLVIGTTNRIDIIDKALLRPSRFRSIAISLPDVTARRAILRHHAGRYHISLDDEVLELIAEATAGRNGDELRSLMRDAFVGRHMHGIEPDARRLGWLVGRLQQGRLEMISERR
ncbi:transitional endoplasmic reticulum ATPase [Streptomyces sp. TLI_55]|uniref:ATP-binding protein n=1 Tax=Streptomyces sp. TLI_55 TaxID=1938861 RepID=UPI000BC4B52C|nr:ATP-binding protein [Streptomyces sp. TLI_55]SNX56830.1 transitional endoplasmic reticulum ATPase [Streptomyces sp. TLI_55]